MHTELRIKVKDTKDRYKKVTRLSSSQWQSLGLDNGTNDITFSVTTQYQVGLSMCLFSQFLTHAYASCLVSLRAPVVLLLTWLTRALQGTASCSARIFLWNYYDRIVISDIDGTITRSDVFGQLLPLVGKDWSQSGVTGLFTNIERNGYRFMYLSARAIGQVSHCHSHHYNLYWCLLQIRIVWCTKVFIFIARKSTFSLKQIWRLGTKDAQWDEFIF